MKTALAILAALACSGCAVNRPEFVERITGTNGVVTERRLVVPSWSLWPASQSIAAQKATLGKTFSLGTTEATQESGGTNLVEALKALDSILGKLKP